MIPSSLSITTSTLLESLFSEEDPEAWQVFDARLRPVLLGVAARMGLSVADAQDAAQECLAQVVASARAGGYDRTKGRLRAWVLAVLRNRVRDVQRRHRDAPAQATESVMGQLPIDAELEQAWEEESRRRLVADALVALRRYGEFSAGNLRAFELFVIQGEPASTVAAELGMTRWAVYKASERCKSRFKEIVAGLTTAYEL